MDKNLEWYMNRGNLIQELDQLGLFIKGGFESVERERDRIENLMQYAAELRYADGDFANGRIKTFFIEYMYVIHDAKNRLIKEFPADQFPEQQNEVEEIKRRFQEIKNFNIGLSEYGKTWKK